MFINLRMLYIVYLFNLCNCQEIIFPSNTELYKGSGCNHSSGKRGICKFNTECNADVSAYRGNLCGFVGRNPLICCVERKFEGISFKGITSPRINFGCGTQPILKPEYIDFECPPEYACSVGAIEPPPHTWPWTALIGKFVKINETKWVCSGSLINNNYVLSAAHCLRESINVVRLGEHNFDDFYNSPHIDVGIIKTIVHPEYKSNPSYHDLVLFQLQERVQFNDYVQPICLPWGNLAARDLVGETVTLSGWGATEFKGDLSPVILEAFVEVFDASLCDESYSTLPNYFLNWPDGINNKFYICAGNTTHSVDACDGDSGGPLMYKDDGNSKYILAGVTSQGYGCGNTEFPGLYANIRNLDYLQWIKDIAF